MKLAISNIAWNEPFDPIVLGLLKKYIVTNIELAPTKHWAKPDAVTKNETKEVQAVYRSLGLKLVSMQSLLFGRPDLSIFETPDQTLQYLKKIVDLSNWLGIRYLVFGSPKNRLRKNLSIVESLEKASTFFKILGDYAIQNDCYICYEANSKAYACDFINTSEEAAHLVKITNSSGFKLHLDTGNMILENENLPVQLCKLLNEAEHVQLSAPNLQPIFNIDRNLIEQIGSFKNYVSIEMLTNRSADIYADIEKSLMFAKGL